jgi:hypothetical protein
MNQYISDSCTHASSSTFSPQKRAFGDSNKTQVFYGRYDDQSHYHPNLHPRCFGLADHILGPCAGIQAMMEREHEIGFPFLKHLGIAEWTCRLTALAPLRWEPEYRYPHLPCRCCAKPVRPSALPLDDTLDWSDAGQGVKYLVVIGPFSRPTNQYPHPFTLFPPPFLATLSRFLAIILTPTLAPQPSAPTSPEPE